MVIRWEPFVIEFTSDSEDSTDDERESVDDTARLPLPTPVQHLAKVLSKPGASPLSKSLLRDHLYNRVLTLSDVQALVPRLNSNRNVMQQMAENIGYNSGHGFIAPLEAEQMLMHILANGDDQNKLFELTQAKIAQFDRKTSSSNGTRRQGLEHNELPVRTKGTTKKQDAKKAKAAPVTGKKAEAAPVAKLDSKKAEAAPVVKVSNTASPSSDIDIRFGDATTLPGDFSRSRLHNGPGLYNRRRPRVCLPRNDTRQVLTEPGMIMVDATTPPGDFSRSRLHNGPGLYDRRRPRVRLPRDDTQ
ncbi:hypothetical protein GMOD_00000833 [Pyrenophora seminiperda CCB06]|uniref:Uncharacterized protein n=1 Tax=Pyrenophora seminiperda CCB06 TaxID=1302712 RepID=A0A3M7M8A5_9PLEO|nr:hypothetical protein GMOD_00000833 [Pyrenophora seminiperda CCB06]